MLDELFSGIGKVFNAGTDAVSGLWNTGTGAVGAISNTAGDLAANFGEAAPSIIKSATGLIPMLQAAGLIDSETVKRETVEYKDTLEAEKEYNSSRAVAGAGIVVGVIGAGALIAALVGRKK